MVKHAEQMLLLNITLRLIMHQARIVPLCVALDYKDNHTFFMTEVFEIFGDLV